MHYHCITAYQYIAIYGDTHTKYICVCIYHVLFYISLMYSSRKMLYKGLIYSSPNLDQFVKIKDQTSHSGRTCQWCLHSKGITSKPPWSCPQVLLTPWPHYLSFHPRPPAPAPIGAPGNLSWVSSYLMLFPTISDAYVTLSSWNAFLLFFFKKTVSQRLSSPQKNELSFFTATTPLYSLLWYFTYLSVWKLYF